MREQFLLPIGFSNHYPGLWMSLCAVVLGASVLEVHVTLDRASWGTDQGASVEFHGLADLIKQIRRWETACGDGVKRLYDSELGSMKRLRRIK